MFLAVASWSQSEGVIITSITLEGNKHTKDKIVFRELNFKIGDTLPLSSYQEILDRNEVLLANSGLFTEAEFTVVEQLENDLKLHLKLKEDWYIFPIPVFELADRNFNVWWVEFNHSLQRVNYGLYFYHKNLTGNKDFLKTVTLGGYTQKLNIEYQFPYLDKKQTTGLFFDILYARNREIPYTTLDNKLTFQQNVDTFMLRRFRTGIGLNYQPRIKSRHEARLFFWQHRIPDIALKLNNNFFNPGETQQRFFVFSYRFIFDDRDYRPYPTDGGILHLKATKEGLGVFNDLNTLYLSARYARYFPISKKWSGELIGKGRVSAINSAIPYYNSRALGYDKDFLRGYEYYVVDGQDYAYGKASLRYQMLDLELNFGKLALIEAFKKIPLKVYLTLNTDHGYVNNPRFSDTNSFANDYLRSYGVGLDFLVYYSRVIELEYSVNHLGERGFFLHFDLFFE